MRPVIVLGEHRFGIAHFATSARARALVISAAGDSNKTLKYLISCDIL